MSVEYIDDGVDSRFSEIIQATIDGEEYPYAPQSRMEALLLELKAVIEAGGGGGGGTTNYNLLTNKPKVNDVELKGSLTGEDIKVVNQEDSLTTDQLNALLALIPN